MGLKPGPKYQIDRIDNNGNYEPTNCQWVTKSENLRNRRNNRLVEFDGETKCLAEWCEKLELDYSRTLGRLNAAWTPEEAFAK